MYSRLYFILFSAFLCCNYMGSTYPCSHKILKRKQLCCPSYNPYILNICLWRSSSSMTTAIYSFAYSPSCTSKSNPINCCGNRLYSSLRVQYQALIQRKSPDEHTYINPCLLPNMIPGASSISIPTKSTTLNKAFVIKKSRSRMTRTTIGPRSILPNY